MTPCHALTAPAAPYRYRAVLDADGWPIIPIRLGRLEWHGAGLTVYMDRSRLLDGSGRCRRARRWQVGHQEALGLLCLRSSRPRSAPPVGRRWPG